MQYDRDLRRGRHAAAICAIINAAGGLYLASNGYWVHAAIAAGWTAGCVVLMDLFRAQQRTRDEVKQVAAMISAGVIAPRSIVRNVVARGMIDNARLRPGSLN